MIKVQNPVQIANKIKENNLKKFQIKEFITVGIIKMLILNAILTQSNKKIKNHKLIRAKLMILT